MHDYTGPQICDFGTLEQLTASQFPLMAAADMTFSAVHQPGGGTVAGTTTTEVQAAGTEGTNGGPTGDGGEPRSGSEGAGGDGGGGESGGGEGDGAGGGGQGSDPAGGAGSGDGGGGGNLPFTGFAAGAAGLLGAGMTAAGHVLRRNLRR